MLTYILELIFFISVGLVTYLLLMGLPAIEGMGDEKKTRTKTSALQERFTRVADERFAVGTIKILRRIRVLVLKIDNTVVRNLDKVKEKAGEQNNKEERAHILKEMDEQTGKEEKE